jgi:UDP-3-O-[3-hydroxymyristoyl] N-acetylglucosamine deacetylase
MAERQTLAREVSVQGITLHAGVPSRLRLLPAPSNNGIVFRRTDLNGSAPIPALWSNVAETRLGTVLRGEDGATVAVVEHLMASLAGAEIDDCFVELEGPEPPLLDGDALSYLVLIERGGKTANGKRDVINVNRTVEVSSASASARLLPSARSEFYFEIDFPTAVIGQQEFFSPFDRETFRREIAPARTFGFLNEAEQLRSAGYGRGADLTNTLVIDGDKLLNPELQRFPDEFVRHKILDAVGDMKLAGYPVVARFEGRKSSHALNNQLLRALFADSANYRIGAAKGSP